MYLLSIVAIGSMLIGVVIFITILHSEKKRRFVLQSEIEALKKSIEQGETKRDIEIRLRELKNLADTVVEEINEDAENKLSTLSNKKIIEFEEYANEVLEKIEINHKEVMFLYDMLNDKVDSVNKIVKELEEAKREVISKDSSVEDIKEVVQNNIDNDFFELLNNCNMDIEQEYEEEEESCDNEISIASVLEEQERQNRQCNVKEIIEDKTESTIDNYMKRNEQIIKLYSLGYSTVDISKKLGIGTGEVALVNNLYHDRLVMAK